MNEQKINCPNCNNPIVFNVSELMKGKSFSCEKCGAKIALSQESENLVKNPIKSLNEIKENNIKKE